MSGSSFLIRLTTVLGLAVAVAAAGCTAEPGSSFGLDSASPMVTPDPILSANPDVTASPVVTATPDLTESPPASPVPTPAPTVAGRDAPPEALLAAEGGDPVMGQLGTYIWLNSGSDAPWLRGAPIAVGAGEPLMVTFAPAGDIASWRARYVPAAANDDTGAVSLGEGTGAPAFLAPDVGTWTVAVEITFLRDVGNANYAWLLDVR